MGTEIFGRKDMSGKARSFKLITGTSLITMMMGSSLGASFGHAQGGDGDENFAFDEIVVVARKRSESLQDVPVTVTAFSGQAIRDAGIERPADFIALTANMTLVETNNAGSTFIVLRGITQNRNSEPSVAVVVDGIQQMSPAQFNQELFDIQQIEVLKGPQGALYGRNAIGGAIVITTEPPADEFEGRVKAGIESGFGYKAQLSVGGPVSDTLKYRLSAAIIDTDGYIENEFLNEKADPYKDISIRGKLLWEPTDNFSADLRVSYSELRTQALYYNIVSDVNDVSLPVRVNNPGQDDRDVISLALKMQYDLGGAILTSVTAYESLEEIYTGDAFDFLPIEESLFFSFLGFDLNQSQFLDMDAWSQDIKISSDTDGDFSWIVGAYAVGTNRYVSTGNMVDTGNGVFPVFRTPSTNPLNPQATFLADEQDNIAWAVYADATYQFSDTFEVNASLRYDEDKREQTTLTPEGYLPNVPGFPQGKFGEVRERTFTKLQPKITFKYSPSENLNLFAGFSTGFRSGGFNQTGVGAIAFTNSILGVDDVFEAEVAETFEVGFKSKLLNGRMILNGSVFSTTSENSYFFLFLAQNSTQNLGTVPEGKLKGFEIESVFRVSDGLDINVGFGYTDSEITDFLNPAWIGNKLPQVSEYTLNVGAQYTHQISDDATMVARVDYQRIGNTWWDLENSTVRKPVDLVDARLSVEWDDWTVTAWAKNLTDKQYNAEFSPGGFVFKAKPRRYGLDISRSF